MDDVAMAWLRRAGVLGAAYDVGFRDINTSWLALGAWARSGFNVLHPNYDATLQMLSTDSAIEDFKLPFSSVMVVLPPAIFETWNGVLLTDDPGDTEEAIGTVRVFQAPGGRLPAVPRSFVWGQSDEDSPLPGLRYHGRYSEMMTGLFPLHGSEEPKSVALGMTAAKTALNYIRAWTAFRPSSVRSPMGIRTTARRGNDKEVVIWRLSKSIHASRFSPTLEDVRTMASGRTPPGIHLVRGHFKRIGKDKRVGWVAPYLRGEGTEATAKIYEI